MARSKKSRELIETGSGVWMWNVDMTSPRKLADGVIAGIGAWYLRFPNKRPVVRMPFVVPQAYRWLVSKHLDNLTPPVRMELCTGDDAVWFVEA